MAALTRSATLHRQTLIAAAGSRTRHRPDTHGVRSGPPFATREHAPLALGLSAEFVRPATDTTSNVRRISLYTPELQLLAETAGSSATTPALAYEYVWFAGQPVAQIESATNTRHYYFNNHLGTPLLQADASGTVIWRVERFNQADAT